MKTQSELQVYIIKSKASQTSTYDNIWLDFGTYRFLLSDIHKKSINEDSAYLYTLETPPNFLDKDFSRILIYKNADKSHKRWFLKGVKIHLQNKIVYENPKINVKFEDGVLEEWFAADFVPMRRALRSEFISEKEISNSIDGMLDAQFESGRWNDLLLKGTSSVEIECGNIIVTQNFVADIPGPNPKLTL